MKSRIMWSVVCIMLLCTSMSGFSQGIEFFKGTFNEALTKASNEGKTAVEGIADLQFEFSSHSV